MDQIEGCRKLCQKLGWSLNHYRITKFLERAGIATVGRPLRWGMPMPELVTNKLVERLRLRLECQKFLDLLQWDWQHPEIREVETKFGYVGELPLQGYLSLIKVLDEAWFLNGGGF